MTDFKNIEDAKLKYLNSKYKDFSKHADNTGGFAENDYKTSGLRIGNLQIDDDEKNLKKYGKV